MSKLEDRLIKLREDWKKFPEKRVFIERQAQSIKKAVEHFSKKNINAPKTKKELIHGELALEDIKKIFTENADPSTQTS